jgi:hypothetical protein
MTTIAQPTTSTHINWKHTLAGVAAAAALVASTVLVVQLVDDSTQPRTTPTAVATESAVPFHIQNLEVGASSVVASAASVTVPAHIQVLEASRTAPVASPAAPVGPTASGSSTVSVPTHILDIQRTLGK